jgi:hypothetical protein
MKEVDGIEPEFDLATPLGPIGEEAEKESTQEEADLMEVYTSAGWVRIREMLQSRIQQYREPLVVEGMSFDEIGKRYVVAQTIADEMQGLLTTMEALYEQSQRGR